MDKWGVILKFGDVLVENYIESNTTKYNFIIEHVVVNDRNGNGTGNFKYYLNDKLEPITMSYWSFTPIVVTQYNWNGIYNLNILITDPKNITNQITHNKDQQENLFDLIKAPFVLLNKYMDYSDWNHYNTMQENVQLKARLKELEEKIKEIEK